MTVEDGRKFVRDIAQFGCDVVELARGTWDALRYLVTPKPPRPDPRRDEAREMVERARKR